MSLENLRGYANKGMICSTRLMAEGVLAVAGRGTLDFSGKTRLNAPEGKWLLARSVVGASDMSSGQDFWQGVSKWVLCAQSFGHFVVYKQKRAPHNNQRNRFHCCFSSFRFTSSPSTNLPPPRSSTPTSSHHGGPLHSRASPHHLQSKELAQAR